MRRHEGVDGRGRHRLPDSDDSGGPGRTAYPVTHARTRCRPAGRRPGPRPSGWTPPTCSSSTAAPSSGSRCAIVFIECGLLFPILPGDSLLFAVGPVHRDRPGARQPRRRDRRAVRGGLPRQRRRLRDRPGRRHAALPTRRGGSSRRSTSTRRPPSSTSTATRPSSSAASCRSCAPSSPSSPASAGWTAAASSRGAPSVPCSGSPA